MRLTKKVSLKEDHYEVSHVEAEQTDIRNVLETITINGNRHIRIYDTSRAEYTDGGFAAPVLAEIDEYNDVSSVREETDSARVISVENDSIVDKIDYKEDKDKSIVGNDNVFLAFIMVICILIRKVVR